MASNSRDPLPLSGLKQEGREHVPEPGESSVKEVYLKVLVATSRGSQLSRGICRERNKGSKYPSFILLPPSKWPIPNWEQRSLLRQSLQATLPGKTEKGRKKDDRGEQKLPSSPSILR